MILTIRQRIVVVLGSIATLAVIVVASEYVLNRAQADAGSAGLDASPHLIAAAARIEPTTEEIEIGAAITGLLKEVGVKEGDIIHRGDVVAVVACGPGAGHRGNDASRRRYLANAAITQIRNIQIAR